MPDKTFDLGDYVTVPERIALFYELFGQGRLVTTDVRLTTEPDGKPRVMVEAAAYRTPDDPLPGRGWSWMLLPGTSNFTRGSELENAETSAWGRAIAALGILTAGGIASNQEVASKKDDAPVTEHEEADENAPISTGDGEETLTFLGKLTKVGTIQKGGPATYQCVFQQSPDGHVFGFKLKLAGDERDIPQVLVKGSYGEGLFMAYVGETAGLIGAHVTVKGRLYNVSKTGRKSYYRLVIGEAENDVIETSVVRIPALLPDATETAAAEAESAPLFDLDESARLDAEEAERQAATA
jgi:hypothetical protein